MKLFQTARGYDYKIDAHALSVSRFVIDAAFTIELASAPTEKKVPALSLRIGGQFRCSLGGRDLSFDPERCREELCGAFRLWGSFARAIQIDGDGTLTLSFEGGEALTVPPDQIYEAWTLTDDDGLLVVGGPADRVSVFRPQQAPDR